jgi:hypothetical protein
MEAGGIGIVPSARAPSSKGACCSARPSESLPGVDVDALSRHHSWSGLHAGLVRLASMDDTVLAALVEHVLADDEVVSS